MTKPSVYTLGGKVQIDLITLDTNGIGFMPSLARLSIQDPEGAVVTFSGGVGVVGGELSTASGYLYYLYRPLTIGWYQYEEWSADATGREGTFTNGFDVGDIVRN